jgi:phosphotransferase system HPr (HPr) family protein
MTESIIVIKNETGIHARPAGLIVKEASKYKSTISIIKNAKVYNGKRVMSIMSMGASKGDEIIIKAEGVDETLAAAAIVELIQSNIE